MRAAQKKLSVAFKIFYCSIQLYLKPIGLTYSYFCAMLIFFCFATFKLLDSMYATRLFHPWHLTSGKEERVGLV